MADELFCHYPPELKCRFTDHGQCSGDLVNLIQCVKSTGAHLRYLKTKGNVSEIDLILNRGGLYDVSDYSKQLILVCKEHRDSLGLYWRKKTKCDYPLHSGVGNVADRAVNKNCSSEIFYMFNCLVPIGSAICKKCRVVHTKMIALLNRSNVSCFGNNADTENGCNSGEVGYENLTDEKNDSQAALPVTSSDCYGEVGYENVTDEKNDSRTALITNPECYDLLSSQTTQASIPSSHEEWEPESSSLEIINEVISLLSNGSLDPLRSQLSVPLTESAPRTQRYYERRAKEIVLQLLEFIAPSQSQLLLEKITDKSDVLNTSSDDRLLQAFVKAYQEASHSPLLQKQILSVISSHFQKNTLLESFPNVTKYKIDVARDYSKKGGMAEPQKLPKSTKFSKLPQEQVQHFVDFISQPQYVQDVAFGERTLKLSTGQKIHIPDIVRTVIGSRIISSYTAYCEETSFHPCKRSTLYELLRNCSATQRKSLCGLDNTTADGICSLEKMISIAEAMESYGALSHVSQDIAKRLRAGKQYLTCDYRWHITQENSVPDHCIQYALSNPDNHEFSSKCDHSHMEKCQNCEDLAQVMDDLEQLIIDGKYPSAEIKTEFMHDFMNCRGKVIQWKQHILRTVNQKNAKHYVLQNLDSTSVLIVLDWAMKFLPWYDRERQTDYYGKKGINWHISVVLMRSDNDQYFSECYAHLFNSFPQGWYTVASIIEHLFSEIKSRHPTITSEYLRSDNAGCYHCGPLVASIPGISERTGIRVCRIDFSEAQSGKDICDRRTAPLKFHAKHYGNEGHNIANAVELKEALESYGGVQNTRVYVAEVDFSYQKLRKCSIPAINHLTNFMFQPDGLTAWQAYNVGVGRKMTNFELKQLSNGVQGETALKILEDAKLQMGSVRGRQSKPRMTIEESREDHEMEVDRCSGTVESAGRNEECSTYVCCECGASFSSLADFNMHHDIGDHNITSEDKVKLLWSHKCSSIKETLISMTSVGGSDTVSSKSEGKMGWALKKQRQCRRFSPAVKDFLFNLYTEGERTGQKYSPTDASKLIRCARDQNGVRTFHTDDWLSTQQIQGLFSRFTQKSLLLKTTEEVDIDLEEILKDIADREKQEKESAMIDRLCETVTDNV